MRHRYTILALAFILVACFAAHATALDTSPYLVSDWITDTHEFREYSSWFIMNPTPNDMMIYAAFYTEEGVFSGCAYSHISPNDAWFVTTRELPFEATLSTWEGVVKFFAFPAIRRAPARAGNGAAPAFLVSPLKFDPNAIIGGVKQHVHCHPVYDWWADTWYWVASVSDVNIKAVTINSSTMGEFQSIIGRAGSCTYVPGTQNEYKRPKTYCESLPPVQPPK